METMTRFEAGVDLPWDWYVVAEEDNIEMNLYQVNPPICPCPPLSKGGSLRPHARSIHGS